jgi:hypothetical protein
LGLNSEDAKLKRLQFGQKKKKKKNRVGCLSTHICIWMYLVDLVDRGGERLLHAPVEFRELALRRDDLLQRVLEERLAVLLEPLEVLRLSDEEPRRRRAAAVFVVV